MLEIVTIFHIAKISLVWAAICAPNNATAAILDVFHNNLTVRAVAQMSACYNAGAIFDSFWANHVNERP